MATSGTGAIITRGQLVNKFGAAYWKNKTLPTTTSDNQCVTAEWINNNINSPNYRWTQAGTYSGAGKKLVKAVHCYNGSTNYLEPVITYSYSIAFSAAPTNINVGSTGKFTVTLTTKTYTGGELSNTTTTDVSSSCTWTSSSTANATVSNNGTVTGVLGLNNGTANGKSVTITAVHATYGTLTADVNIKDVITSKFISITSPTSAATIYVGATQTYAAKKYHRINNGTTNYDMGSDSISWSSSNTSVATMSGATATGKAGKGDGTETTVATTITASLSGYTSATQTLNVKDRVTDGSSTTMTSYSNLKVITPLTSCNVIGAAESVTVTTLGTVTTETWKRTYKKINGVENLNYYTDGPKTTKTGVSTNDYTLTTENTDKIKIDGRLIHVMPCTTGGAVSVTATGTSAIGTSLTSSFAISIICRWCTVNVNPTSASINVGGTQQIIATSKMYENGTAGTGTPQCSWSSSNTTCATISPSTGSYTTVRGRANGSSTITAACQVSGYGDAKATSIISVGTGSNSRGKLTVSSSKYFTTIFSQYAYNTVGYTGTLNITEVFKFLSTNNLSTISISGGGTSITLSNSAAWKTGYYYFIAGCLGGSGIEENYLVELFVSSNMAANLNSGTDGTTFQVSLLGPLANS